MDLRRVRDRFAAGKERPERRTRAVHNSWRKQKGLQGNFLQPFRRVQRERLTGGPAFFISFNRLR